MPVAAVAAAQRGNRLPFGGPWFIYFGRSSDSPTPAYMVANQALVRSRAAQFDGATVFIPSCLSRVMAPALISQATIQADLAGWAAADFGGVNRNWAYLIWCGCDYGPGTPAECNGATPVANTDWTNNAHWATIAQNFGNLAAVLRQVGKFVGIFFDNEAYCVQWNQNTYPWNWGGDSNTPTQTGANGLGILPGHSRDAALALVKSRGAQIMDAILDAWPECHVMQTHSAFASDYYAGEAAGTHIGWNNLWWTSELKAPFYYGMVQRTVARGQGYIWDGGEMYGLRSQTQHFDMARFRLYEAPRVPSQWVYTDPLRDHRILASQAIFNKDEFNGFAFQSDAALEQQLIWMMRANQSYVWMYTEDEDWWGGVNSNPDVAQSRLDAIAEGKLIGRGGLGTGGTAGPASYTHNGSDVVVLTDASSQSFSGAGGASSFSDTFTGSDGAAWASPWVTTTSGSGVVDIQGNRGRLVTPSASLASRALYGTLASGEITVKWSFPATTVTSYLNLVARVDSWVDPYDYPLNGYHFQLRPASNELYLFEWTAGGAAILASAGYTFSSGTDVWMKVRFEGSALRLRVWNVGGSEPGTWNLDTTDTSYTSGNWGVSASGATGSITAYVDDMSGTSLSGAGGGSESLSDTLALTDAQSDTYTPSTPTAPVALFSIPGPWRGF